MRQNTFYGSKDDNSDVGEIIKFIDRQGHLSDTYKDLFANRLVVKPSEDELRLAGAPAVCADGVNAYTDGGLGLRRLPESPSQTDICHEKQTLIELCREFDAIDLSECNRRLEAGEKFDAACDKAMEKRIALADQLKTRLGDDWVTFEAYAEVSDPKDSAEAALWELATAIASRLSGHVAEQDIELVKPQLSRLVGLFS